MFPPLLTEPPNWHLPDPSENPLWYGEVWVNYPLSRCLVPQYFGQVFKTKSLFRILMNEACQIAYSTGSEMTMDKADQLFKKLEGWYNALPSPLRPEAVVLPAHLQLQ